MKKAVALLAALAIMLSLAACGNAQTAGEKPSASKDEISVCLASEPDNIDPALNSTVDGATLINHLFSGLAKWTQKDDGSLAIAPDCVEELVEGVANDDGTVTYTYTLRGGMVWSDGEPVTAQDFEYSWKRASSPALSADYTYMYDVVDGYAEMWEVDADGNYVNPDAELNVRAVDEKTLEVTLANAVPYWNELLAFPVYFPVRRAAAENEAWATSPSTFVCNGAYTMASWEHNSVITLVKNEKYHGADAVTMEKIKFFLSDDYNNMLTNFKNGAWQLIDSVPTNEIAVLKTDYPDEFVVAGQIGTYFTCWNINVDILPQTSGLTGESAEAARSEIRRAVALLFDRNYITEQLGQAGQVPASSFVAMGMTEPDGSQFYENAGHSADYTGYYDVTPDAYRDNWDSALEILKKYYTYDEAKAGFTDFPPMTYLYNTSDSHKAIGEYLAGVLASVGITLNLENQEWGTFLNTRKSGGYTVAYNGWLADYNDPICFLDMWISTSGNNDVQFGRQGHESMAIYSLDLTPYGYDVKADNATWAETYDVLISTIKGCTDPDVRYELMHLAEDMVMSTGCIMPIYFYTDIYMLDKNVDGFFSNPLGFKYFMYCTIE